MAKVRIEHISKSFRAGTVRTRILRDISLELPERGLVAIFGKSGSGKTTLLNIIGGLDRQDSGKIFIDGENTAGHTDAVRNRKIGFIFQNYYLESGYTVDEILHNQMVIAGFRDEAEIRRRADEVLRLVDLERFRSKRGDALSGGQKQRVAIARALIKGAEIILADEPTGNLDAENTVKVMNILKEISKTRLVVLVTHEVTLIHRYADSHIKLVDGQIDADGKIDEGELASATYEEAFIRSGSETGQPVAGGTVSFTPSPARRSGRLFSVRQVLRLRRADAGEKGSAAADVFKQIFILAMAAVMCFFAFTAFEVLNTAIDNKPLSDTSVYVNMNTYSDLRRLSSDLYSSIDFFETQRKTGRFSYLNMAALSDITLEYTPRALDSDTAPDGLYGQMPGEGEVLITRCLAERLKTELRLDELCNDRSVLLSSFEDSYRVSGIIPGDEPLVYMNRVDYINFLGVYASLCFSDVNHLFFEENYDANAFSTEICLADSADGLADNEVRIEINRNALYRMMGDVTQADYKVETVNSRIAATEGTSTAIYIVDSKPLYVQKFVITREAMTTDIRVYMGRGALERIFLYVSPNLDLLTHSTSSSGVSSDYYFAISTEGGDQLTALKNKLRDRGIFPVDVADEYQRRNQEILSEQARSLILFAVMTVLLYLIFFFIAKSESVRNSKEYGVFRAIGVNRSNLIFREAVSAVAGSLVSYTVFSILLAAGICARYAIMNTAFTGFLALCGGAYLVSALLMVGISVIPYLFVLVETPSRILARYDI